MPNANGLSNVIENLPNEKELRGVIGIALNARNDVCSGIVRCARNARETVLNVRSVVC